MSRTYKGNLGPVPQRGIRRYVRGRGWETLIRYRGQNVDGIIAPFVNANQVSEVVITDEENGVYSTLEAVLQKASVDAGGEVGPPVAVWGIHTNIDTVSIFESPAAKDMEAAAAGTVGIIQDAYDAYVAGSIQRFTQYDQAKLSIIAAGGMFNTAERYFYKLVHGVTSYRVYQPVITLRQSVGEAAVINQGFRFLSQVIGPEPLIYENTADLVARLNNYDVSVPFPYDQYLPEGFWLEQPLNIDPGAEGYYDAGLQWEWYRDIDPDLYPNTF